MPDPTPANLDQPSTHKAMTRLARMVPGATKRRLRVRITELEDELADALDSIDRVRFVLDLAPARRAVDLTVSRDEPCGPHRLAG